MAVPQTAEYQLGQAIRDWMLAMLPNVDPAKVLISQRGQMYDVNGDPTGRALQTPRPEVPFAVINIITSDQQVGHDDKWVDGPSETLNYRGLREGTVDIQGFGLPTYDWLAHLGMRYPEADDITLIPTPGIQDLSALEGEDYIEARYSKEFELIYAIEPDVAINVDVAETTEISRDFGDTITEDL